MERIMHALEKIAYWIEIEVDRKWNKDVLDAARLFYFITAIIAAPAGSS